MEYNHPDEADSQQELHGQDIKIDFSAFVLSLASSALVSIGELPDPISKETKKNLGVAKQMIDVINMLKEKTAGNLSKEEEELVTSLSSELKLKYLHAINIK